MQKIKFNNSDRIFDVTLSRWGKNRIKCTFHTAVDIRNSQFLKSGFKELNEKNLRVQGNHSKMKYIYQQSDDNTVVFTSDPNDTCQTVQDGADTDTNAEPIAVKED